MMALSLATAPGDVAALYGGTKTFFILAGEQGLLSATNTVAKSFFYDIASGVKGWFAKETVTNPIPETFARVVPGNVSPENIGKINQTDVFVTDANSLKGLSPKEISQKLAIPESDSFTIIEFPSQGIEGVASPIA